MEIYLDANATTPVLDAARAAALSAMAEDYGNPSSIHSTGLKARALIEAVRERARKLLGAGNGRLLFISGATEGIQTAVLSALHALRSRREAGDTSAELLLYGATEHKAVPEALKHWNELLGLSLQVQAIPVGRDGRHDLDWLRQHAPRAGLVCTMAANNETGVVSDLAGIEAALQGSATFWLVDGVQALGKLQLDLATRRIDYAPFSGHKLYAPKGVGLLYVREGAPFTPLMAGGGQEGALRSGTENMSGIAALGAVLEALQDGKSFRDHATLVRFRDRLADALREAFPGLVFNAPLEQALPTTLNFSVPGLASRLLLDLFDAAELRVSGGSACSAAKAQPSFVLQAMGLPDEQTASAVRLSFGPAADEAFIIEACERIRVCGETLRANCLAPGGGNLPLPGNGISRYLLDGECCWLVADADKRQCVVIDPLAGLVERLAQQLRCQGYPVVGVLATDASHEAACEALRAAVPELLAAPASLVRQLPLSQGRSAWLLGDERQVRVAFIGQASVEELGTAVQPATLLAASRDLDNQITSTPSSQLAGPSTPARSLDPQSLHELLKAHPDALVIDVREPFEQRLGQAPVLEPAVAIEAVPVSRLLNTLPAWLAMPAERPVVFFCRSGNRSLVAANLLKRLGHEEAYSLAGGLALWPQRTPAAADPALYV
ncbi:aminotransferase class V-fold PLP-dependent enzyme [Pelomonas sp. SE-A7]|uniref:aminotransferase class V-fold PLP-dependent enzyme n=1 Tax=Pelomonas sp. SE-A7 TaxID=3054953 RepID=UPI00259CD820|nr:aminotransferase class V-fold PLP-dependent enzyme [Pelomonas sp. SE-A7]MDM4766502.1 aminotransferase class V-fold PLP-dependent enzyme [Pelomonas sp. SE-A7]